MVAGVSVTSIGKPFTPRALNPGLVKPYKMYSPLFALVNFDSQVANFSTAA